MTPNAVKTISTPGNLESAIIYPAGLLNKSVDLTPFSVDPAWNATADEFGGGVTNPHSSDDILFGGLGNDSMHGGSGDDALSGGEALTESYLQTQDPPRTSSMARCAVTLIIRPIRVTPSFTTRFGARLPLYDEYNPMRKILLNNDGTLSAGAGKEFFLNFNALDGPAIATGSSFHTDGDDVVFGDLGNDWIVGGTGRDHLYGGWGNDLLNADDDLTTATGLNNAPDTDPSYNDVAYGGAGLDVLIANTGGDRLIDWVGEFNSYLVPFSPFGLFTVVRLVQPQLPEFLYGLSKPVEPTRALAGVTGTATGSSDRNGEPCRRTRACHPAGRQALAESTSTPETRNPVTPRARSAISSARRPSTVPRRTSLPPPGPGRSRTAAMRPPPPPAAALTLHL